MHRYFARNSKKSKIWLWWCILWEEWFASFQNAENRFSRSCAVVYMSIKGNRAIVFWHCFLLCFQYFRSPPNRKWTLRSISHDVTISHKIQPLSISNIQIRSQSIPVRYPSQGRQFRPGCRSCRSCSCRPCSCRHRRCSVSRFQRAADEVKLVRLNST